MRRLLTVSMVLAMAWAMSALAGEGGAPEGGRQRGPGGRQRGPGGFRGGPIGGMFDRFNRETDLFSVARRAVTLADDKLAALENLAIEYAIAEDEANAETRKRLNKEYLAKVVALLPDAEKPKYEKAIAAMTERDDAIATAEKALRETLDKVRTNQGADKVRPAEDPARRFFQPRRGEVPTRKYDVLRTCFVLTDDQTKQIEVIHDANRNAVREKMRGQFANLRPQGGGRPDPAAFRRMAPLFRQARTQADDEDAKAIANLLTDAQKPDFATACTAMDTYRKAISDAEEACRKKVVEALGQEKADAILGLTAEAAAAPGAANPAPKGTEF